MASKTAIKSAKVASPGELGDSKAASKIRFSATLLRPKVTGKAVSWTFLTLPKEASAKLPSRSMTSVEGTFNGSAFQATLEPDGQEATGSKSTGKTRRVGARRRAKSSRWKSRRWQRSRNPRCRQICGRLSRLPRGGAEVVVGHHAHRAPRLDSLDRLRQASRDPRASDQSLPATCSTKESDARAASIGRGCMTRASVAP